MPRNQLRYDVEVNTRDGVRELERLGQAGKDAGDDIAKGFDEAESASKAALSALSSQTDKLEAELKGTAETVEVLARALGPDLTARTDLEQVIGDLRKMGLTFDDIKGDAIQFAAALKRVDDIKLGAANAGLKDVGGSLDRARTRTDELDQSARGANSAMANMVGNATQDLGALAGVAGSAGVAIGQMAEYAADARLSGEGLGSVLKNMAVVAGPIAGIAAVMGVMQSVMADNKRIQEAWTTSVEAFSEALGAAGSDVAAINTVLAENRELLAPLPEGGFFFQLAGAIPGLNQLIGETDVEINKVLTAMADANITSDQWAQLLADGADEMERARDAGDEIEFADATDLANLEAGVDVFERIRKAEEDGLITGEQAIVLMNQYADNVKQVDAAQRSAAAGNEVFKSSLTGINQALHDQEVATKGTEQGWKAILGFIAQGKTDIPSFANSWNILRERLELTDAEMAEIVQQKLDEQLADDAAAAEDAAAKILEVSDALQAAKDNAAEYNQVVSSADWGATSLEAAETALSSYFEQFRASGDIAAANEEAYDGLSESIKASDEAGLSWFETLHSIDSPEGRNARRAMHQLADSLIPEIQQAYDDADGDQQKFYDNMADVGTRTLAEMQTELGLTTDEANALAQQIGLTPEMVETTFKMIGVEEAKLKLDLLQGYIDDLPEDVQTTVTQQILLGDYVETVATVQNYANTHPASLTVDANVEPALAAIRRVIDLLNTARLIAQITNNVANASVAPSSASTSSTAVVPMTLGPATYTAPARPVNVTVNTAVVGDRYQVQRVVARAVRGGIRLAGVRA